MIACGSTAQSVAAAVSRTLDEPLVDLLPDGAVDAGQGVEVGEDERVVVVASTTSDRAHLELLELQERACRRSPAEVVTVLAYMGYARQDQVFEPGQPLSSRAVARAIGAGTDRMVTVNPHNEDVLRFFGVPADPVDTTPRLARPLPADLSDPVFLGPDEGATELASSVRDAYGSGSVDYFEKARRSATDVRMDPGDGDFAGRDVVVVDDMIATGGTMREAVAILDDRDADRVFVTCVHPVLAEGALRKLYQAGVETVYATDTIDRSVSQVSAAPVIAEAL